MFFVHVFSKVQASPPALWRPHPNKCTAKEALAAALAPLRVVRAAALHAQRCVRRDGSGRCGPEFGGDPGS